MTAWVIYLKFMGLSVLVTRTKILLAKVEPCL